MSVKGTLRTDSFYGGRSRGGGNKELENDT